MIVYNKNTGIIVANISNDQDYNIFFHNYSDEFKSSLNSMIDDSFNGDIRSYKVVSGSLIKMSEAEIMEINKYGRFLTEEERLLEKLKPSYDEVERAKNTIEILTLLQEVM